MTVNYQEYIRSEEWREKSDAAKERAGYRCQICNTPDSMAGLQTHHRTYERLGYEDDSDLTVLCDDCHSIFEREKKMRKPGANPPSILGMRLRRTKKSRQFIPPER